VWTSLTAAQVSPSAMQTRSSAYRSTSGERTV
jgi:hypothetical protein